MLFLVLYTVAEVTTKFWLSHWTAVHKEGTNTSVDDGLSYHLGIYGALGGLQSESNFYFRGDVKIPTYKPHTNHKKPSVRSHTLAPTSICDLSHSICGSQLTDLGHISSVTYVCHPLWFVCGHRKGILTSPLTNNRYMYLPDSP